MMRPNRRCRGEAGQAAGIETVPFGILVLVSTTMLVLNVWATIDARSTLDNAARDYLRAYTAAATRDEARREGTLAFDFSVGDRWPDHAKVLTAPPEAFGPCRVATVSASIEIDAVRIPFLGSIGSRTITATQSELVQPYNAAADEFSNLPPTVCDG